MNDLKDRNQQIDVLLNDIIVSDDAVASAEKAQEVYNLVSSETLDEPVRTSFAAFYKAAEEERLYNEFRLKRLERSRKIALITAAACLVLYSLAWIFLTRSSTFLVASVAFTVGAFTSAVYERRLADLETKLLRQRLDANDMMMRSMNAHMENLQNLQELRAKI